MVDLTAQEQFPFNINFLVNNVVIDFNEFESCLSSHAVYMCQYVCVVIRPKPHMTCPETATYTVQMFLYVPVTSNMYPQLRLYAPSLIKAPVC